MRIYPIKGPDHPFVKFLFKPFLLRLCPLINEDMVVEYLRKFVTHIKASSRSLVLLNMLSSVSVLLRDGDNPAKEYCAGTVKWAACLSDLLWKWYCPIGTSWTRSKGGEMGYKLQLLPCHLDHNIWVEKKLTHSSVDLPILISHAVSVVQVSKGLGCSPGLQIAGHPDWRSHLGSVQSVSGTVMMLRAPALHLHMKGVPFYCILSHSNTNFTPFEV